MPPDQSTGRNKRVNFDSKGKFCRAVIKEVVLDAEEDDVVDKTVVELVIVFPSRICTAE